jgi:hypothetical protein
VQFYEDGHGAVPICFTLQDPVLVTWMRGWEDSSQEVVLQIRGTGKPVLTESFMWFKCTQQREERSPPCGTEKGRLGKCPAPLRAHSSNLCMC